MIPGIVASGRADLGVSITDAFGGSGGIDGRATETGSKTWDVTDGSTWTVSGGFARCTAGTPAIGHAVAWLDLGFADGTIEGHATPISESGTGSRHGLVFRYVDDLNHWTLYHYRTGGGAEGYYLRGWSAGALSYDSGFVGIADGALDLRVELLGTSIKVYWNDVLVQSITNSLHQSATKHGICSSVGYGDVADFAAKTPSTPTATFVQATNNKNSGTTSPVIPKPSGAATGNLLVAFYQSRGVTTFTPPAGWTTLFEQDTAGGGDEFSGTTIHVCYRVVQAGDPTSWTATTADNRAYGVGVVEVAGAAAVPITAYSGNGAQTSTTVTFTGITVPSNNSLLIGAAAIVGTTTGNPTDTTERWDLGSGAGSQAAGDGWTKQVDAGATGNLTAATDSASPNAWTAVLVAVNPAA